MNWELNVQIDDVLKEFIDESWLRQVVRETIDAEKVETPVELGLVITDDETIRQLNRTYRGRDEPTDVLSFAFHQEPVNGDDAESLPFVTPPDGVRHLGEVIISYDRAVTQAEQERHSVKRELALLVIHGVLHLLGYDDEQPENEQKMRAREARILDKIDIKYK